MSQVCSSVQRIAIIALARGPQQSILVTALAGQQPAPVFRAGTKLVEVTVTVLDKKGHAVAGLEGNDFTILDEGKPRPVAFFRFDAVPATITETRRPVTLPAGIFTNRPAIGRHAHAQYHRAGARCVEHCPAAEHRGARADDALPEGAGAANPGRDFSHEPANCAILHDFTDDPAALRAKLEKAVMGMPLATVTDYRQSVVEAEAFVNMFPPEQQAQAADMARAGSGSGGNE